MGSVHKLKSINLEPDLKALLATIPELQGAGDALEKLLAYLKPLIFWRDFKIDVLTETEVVLDGGELVIESAYVAMGLNDCNRATLLAATIGKDLPRYSSECIQAGNLWEGTIADIFGSHAVEALVDKFQKYLSQAYLGRGLYPSLRFSPGYGDWSLRAQRDIIALLEASPAIKVTESFLLEPVKSVTAVIGWSPYPVERQYPRAERKLAFCEGLTSCAYCRTWACKKGQSV